MKFNRYQTLVEAIQNLRTKGFKNNFSLVRNKMKCENNGQIYSPDEMRITEYHRFGGKSNPSDMSIVFAIACDDGIKGLIVSSFGVYGNLDMISFLNKVKIAKKDFLQQEV